MELDVYIPSLNLAFEYQVCCMPNVLCLLSCSSVLISKNLLVGETSLRGRGLYISAIRGDTSK